MFLKKKQWATILTNFVMQKSSVVEKIVKALNALRKASIVLFYSLKILCAKFQQNN